MPTPKPLPKRSELVDYQHAVAGHAGTMSDPDGLLFIKPCTQSEIDFYEAARTDHPELADLMPVYMGTLMLSDAADTETVPPSAKAALSNLGLGGGGGDAATPETPAPETETAASSAAAAIDNDTWVPRGTQKIITDRAIVMKNTTHGYCRPNILDIKLGQRLWADDAPRQKRVRMDEVRAQTTHDKLGFRIAGMRVYSGSPAAAASESQQQQQQQQQPKTTADAAAGQDAAASRHPDPGTTMTINANGYRVYSKDFGRYTVDDGNVVDALRQFLFVEEAGVDADHARALAQAFKTRLAQVCAVLEKERTRMFSASLLFVYEGHGPALQAAIAATNAAADAVEAAEAAEAAAKAAGAAESAPQRRKQKPRPQEPSEEQSEEQIQEQAHEPSQEPPQKRQRRGRGNRGSEDAGQPTEATEPLQTATTETTETAETTEAAADTPDAWDRPCRSRREPLGKAGDRSSSRTDSGIVMEDEADEGDDADSATYLGSEFEDDDDDDEEESALPPVCDVRLIDFAHAKFVGPDEQPDENTLVGIRSLIRIFDELAQ